MGYVGVFLEHGQLFQLYLCSQLYNQHGLKSILVAVMLCLLNIHLWALAAHVIQAPHRSYRPQSVFLCYVQIAGGHPVCS